MKKSVLFSFFMLSILLAWCENYNNFTTYEEKTTWCEKWILSHWTSDVKFERKGSEKSWNMIVITWIQHDNDWSTNQEIKCEFNENGKLLWIKSSTLIN